MKRVTATLIFVIILSACTKGQDDMQPFTDVEKAVEYVRLYDGPAEGLRLLVSDELNDQMGINMAIITDSVLAKKFQPNGFEQQNGFKVYAYKPL